MDTAGELNGVSMHSCYHNNPIVITMLLIKHNVLNIYTQGIFGDSLITMLVFGMVSTANSCEMRLMGDL